MSNLFIQGTKSTPAVDFDRAAGLDRPTTVEIDLKYLNTSSTKCLMNLFRLFSQSPRSGELVTIH